MPRKRNKQILFCVTEEEWVLIRKKMVLSHTRNMGAYLRKMAIDGYIINIDTSEFKQQLYEMHKIGVNINQIAKVANTTGTVNQDDIKKVKEMVKSIWHILKSSQSKLL